jgi:hypothetical protein
LRFEDGLTRFQTLEEARPHMARAERTNMVARAMINSLRRYHAN